MRRLLPPLLALLFAGCPPPAPTETTTDPARAFRDLADKTAERDGARVVAWGEARLAGDREPRRFAVLEPDDPMEGRGAYLIEDRPGKVWRVSYVVDGRTLPWGLAEGASLDADPTWTVRKDRAIEHEQAFHHGGERTDLALRDGEIVVLYHEVTGDAEIEVPERRRFAVGGVCKDPCPALSGFETEADLQVEPLATD